MALKSYTFTASSAFLVMKQIKTIQTIKYFIYCRKSSEEEDRQILSLDAQKRELEEFATKSNLFIVDIFMESKSAFKTGRPIYGEMLQRIEKDEANAVICWQPNRISRNPKDGGEFIYMMDLGFIKELRTPYKAFINSADDKFFLNLEFGIAKKDSDDKSENVKRGNRQKILSGDLPCRAPQGYLNVTDPITKRKYVDIDPERFNLIQKAIQLILYESHTPMQALIELNKWGYITRKTLKMGGKKVCDSLWYNILNNPFYYGKIERKDIEAMGNHTPMITEDEYNRIQIILGNRGKPTIKKESFYGKGILKCGACGGNITAHEKWQIICPNCKTKFHRSDNTVECPSCSTPISKMKNLKLLHYVYYSCVNNNHRKCNQRSMTEKTLEDTIKERLGKIKLKSTYRDWAIKYINEITDDDLSVYEKGIESLAKRKIEIDKTLDNLLKSYISPINTNKSVISDDEYINQKDKLTKELKNAEDEFNKADRYHKNWRNEITAKFNFAHDAPLKFATSSFTEKANILSKIGLNLTVKDRKLNIEGDPVFFLIEEAINKSKVIEKKLEPIEMLTIEEKSAHLAELNQTWLPDMDSNHD
ncbi:hypothetical protein COV25_04180 [candidate division WWE3 bacterium CG10_big_fil_rev_8_21_14_0_10_35_32]|nr:MAG: hypothetical protein COV25_04180 [candidate division WWE3 bacterium CG10_big_fil_rev_8_21_14_0_10_35_32]